MRNIIIPLFDQVSLLDASGPADVFALANSFIAEEKHYRVVTVADTRDPIRAYNGMVLIAEKTFADDVHSPYIILVPGGPGAYDNEHPALYEWLWRYSAKAKLYGSVCTGAFILGRAGLLNGKETTTHWNFTNRLAQEFPTARVAEGKIITRDDKLVCSGGITTGIDLALELVEKDHGRTVAVNVSKMMLLNIFRHGGQLQFNTVAPDLLPENSGLNLLIPYIKQNLSQRITVSDLAATAQLSIRQLTRRFAQETNMTPMAFVQALRIDHARMLLETTDSPLKTLAYQCGFGCVRQMTDLFKKRLGITPLQYRRQFR